MASLNELLGSDSGSTYQLRSKAPGPTGTLPLDADMLLHQPSGNLFGWTQNAGMGWNPAEDARDMAALGFDAISAYARGGSYSMTQPSFAEQCALIRRDRWEKSRALRIPSVTFASAGWDTRPRNERPPSWCTWVTATPDKTPPAQQKPLIDSVTATPDELAAHIREALDWTKANRDINPSNAVIIYGWNENDEGGWLLPTLGTDGRPDETRVNALGKVLQPRVRR